MRRTISVGFSPSLAVFLALTVFAGVALAKIPPLSREDLAERADLISVGTVKAVRAVGKVTHDHCYGWQRFVAQVALAKPTKGIAPKGGAPVTVRFDRRVQNDKGCVGGRSSYTLTVGDRYTLYLRRAEDGSYHPFHWMCVAAAPEPPKTP